MQVPNWSREVLQDVLSDALSQAWTPAQEAILGSEAGVETVIDAVGRVNAAAQVLLSANPFPLGQNVLLEHVSAFVSQRIRHASVTAFVAGFHSQLHQLSSFCITVRLHAWIGSWTLAADSALLACCWARCGGQRS